MRKKALFLMLMGFLFSLEGITWYFVKGACAEKITFISTQQPAVTEVSVMDSEGRNLRTLTKSPTIIKFWPTWSPDRKTIAFVTHAPNHLYLMDADGSNLIVLKKDYPSFSRPAWSPDGRKIAYGSTFFIFLFDVGTKKEKGVLVSKNFAGNEFRDVAWAPDGHQLTFAAKKNDQRRDIYVMNVDGTGLRQLTQHPAEDHAPTWSPDGQKIVFFSGRRNRGGLFLIDVDGLNLEELTNGAEDYPSWSPDSSQIACVVPFVDRSHVAVMNANGGKLKVLVQGHSPSWQSIFPNLSVAPKGKLVSTWGRVKFGGYAR